ncbi:O-antigen polymerase [Vibrio sinaloensis DSM 21326]|uniref:O-antigen polymerase n=1 Tax=Vibrio sinaloensis DSM 21326 TaxID=945550 RepID=E8MAW8_PHOS4|nr:O-antigen ligase family protein [Vibrio sinaloensis]EGA68798.1 O-antigen polymerase [Vibrio sinaloensis DSM 21326]
MARLEKLSFYLLLGLIIWLPIPLASNRVWAWSIAEAWIAIQSLLLIASYVITKTPFPFARVWRFSWLLIPLGVFQIWVGFQLIPLSIPTLEQISPSAAELYLQVGSSTGAISLDTHATKTAWVKGLSYTLFAFNAAVLIYTTHRLRQVLYVIVFSGAFQAFYGAMAVLLNWEHSLVFGFKESGVATGSFVYKNHLANYLMLCLALGIGLIVSQLHVSASGNWSERLKRWSDGLISRKMFVRLALVIMVIALVMTRSRMGNTAFFLATTVGAFAALLFYRQKPRALMMLIVSLIIVDTAVVGSVFGLDKVKERLEQTSALQETRDEVVQWSLPIVRDYAVTGTGAGTFYTVFPMYSQYNIGFYDHAHNDYLQFVVEVGIPATLLLGFCWLWAMFIAVKSMRQRNSKTLKGTALGGLIGLIGMLIHISVDFNLQAPANSITFILVLVLVGCSASIKVVNRPKEAAVV